MAARWAGVLDTFDEMPKHRRVDVVALYEVGWRMDAVNAHEAQERAKRQARRRGRRR